MNGSTVEVLRESVAESRHRVHVAVVDAGGRLRAASGDPDLVTFFRSCAKPFQALAMISDGVAERFGLSSAEIAICCGSHSGEPKHLKAVRSILAKSGADAEALACGAHPPFHAPSRRALVEAGLEPVRLHNNCSGKHAGMVALARGRGWGLDGYHRPDHPVQGRVRAEVARWAGMPEEALIGGNDGCGVVCFALPIRNMAAAYARLAAAARRGERGAATVVGAMTEHPDMVAGSGRLCTDLMRRGEGRLFATTGAEGVYCVGVPGAELGVAIKVEDGADRAIAPAILEVLRQLELISEDDFGALHSHAFPAVLNTRGEIVGKLSTRILLEPQHA